MPAGGAPHNPPPDGAFVPGQPPPSYPSGGAVSPEQPPQSRPRYPAELPPQYPPQIPPQDQQPNQPQNHPPTGPNRGALPTRDEDNDGADAPTEVKRATNLATLVAALLVFLAVLNATQFGAQVTLARRAVVESAPELADQFSDSLIKAVLIVSILLTAAVAIGFGLTAHGLRGRKSWARPVGFTFSGILIGLAVLSLGTGAAGIPLLVLGFVAVWLIILLARPTVRDYLKRRPALTPPSYPPTH